MPKEWVNHLTCLSRGEILRVKRVVNDDQDGTSRTYAVSKGSQNRIVVVYIGTGTAVNVEKVLNEMGWVEDSKCTPDCQKHRLVTGSG